MLGISVREKQVQLYSATLWCNDGRTRFQTVWPVFEIVREGISELVEFVGSVIYSAPKGFNLCIKN